MLNKPENPSVKGLSGFFGLINSSTIRASRPFVNTPSNFILRLPSLLTPMVGRAALPVLPGGFYFAGDAGYHITAPVGRGNATPAPAGGNERGE